MREPLADNVIMTVFGGVTCVLLSLFIHAAWSTANEGRAMAAKNTVDVAEMKVYYQVISHDLEEIKSLLKRGIPHDI